MTIPLFSSCSRQPLNHRDVVNVENAGAVAEEQISVLGVVCGFMKYPGKSFIAEKKQLCQILESIIFDDIPDNIRRHSKRVSGDTGGEQQ